MDFFSQNNHRTTISHAAQFRFAPLFASPPYETRGSAARMVLIRTSIIADGISHANKLGWRLRLRNCASLQGSGFAAPLQTGAAGQWSTWVCVAIRQF